MALSRQINSLLLKSNRILETRLAESGLLQAGDLEEANRLFLTKVREGNILNASMLRLLVLETQKLDERKLLNYQLEQSGIGGVSLPSYNVREDTLMLYSVEEYKATWTVPIDHYGECTIMASCYYLSDFVRQYWEDKTGHRIIWYLCKLEEMQNFLNERFIESPVAQ
ncbi:MAG: hypothetical protein LR015_03380 [Verrucomicrobia bacterium]|nr:hypothetical protein [Verrucomicrobiota bacterium]